MGVTSPAAITRGADVPGCAVADFLHSLFTCCSRFEGRKSALCRVSDAPRRAGPISLNRPSIVSITIQLDLPDALTARRGPTACSIRLPLGGLIARTVPPERRFPPFHQAGRNIRSVQPEPMSRTNSEIVAGVGSNAPVVKLVVDTNTPHFRHTLERPSLTADRRTGTRTRHPGFVRAAPGRVRRRGGTCQARRPSRCPRVTPSKLVARLARQAELVSPAPLPLPASLRDPKDLIVLAAAVAARADAIVTGDNDLLSMECLRASRS